MKGEGGDEETEEGEMNQLRTMGFPDNLAAQALAATGGKSILRATEWLLNHHSTTAHSASHYGSPVSSQTQTQTQSLSQGQSQQPRLDRFFHSSQSRATPSPPTKPPDSTPETSSIPPTKRLKPSPPPPPPQQKQPLQPSLPEKPLAERMRPQTIEDVIGQDHILGGPNTLLRSAISCNCLPSILLWGPPGTGKTSIAKAITASMASSRYRFVSLSAVTSGVKDVRDAVEDARKRKKLNGKRTVLFVDEVHRFNKSQQDSFLPVIEDGSIVFVGATTENPSFHMITPLLSRCRVLTLNPLGPGDISILLRKAVDDQDKGLSRTIGSSSVEVNEDAIELLASQCDGDARVALNALEVAAITAKAQMGTRHRNCQTENLTLLNQNDQNHNTSSSSDEKSDVVVVTLEDAKVALQCKHLAYDKAGEEHYNLISAFHKSIRGSDANASIYWLARMLEGGEEPLYIARRLVRIASEDVGLADPSSLTQAVACYQACHFIGMPECDAILGQCAAYLALAPKSVAVYKALGEARSVIRKSIGGNEGVPLHLRNAPTKLMKEVGYGKGYIYTPDDPLAYQSFLPPSLEGYKFLHWPPGKDNEDGGGQYLGL